MLHASAAVAANDPDSSHPQHDQSQADTRDDAALYRFCLRAVREPSVLPRVVEMFTLRDLIPQDLRCRVCPDCADEMELELSIGTLTPEQAQTIAARMLNLVPVLRVSLDGRSA